MSEDQLQAMLDKAASSAVKKFAEEHPCRLSERERHRVHSLSEIMDEESADTGTLRILVQYGKGAQDVTKQVRRVGIMVLFVVLALLAVACGPEWIAKLGKVVTK